MIRNQNMIAVGLALMASAILSFIDNFVAEVAQEAGLWQFHFFRTLIAVPLLVMMGRLSGLAVVPKSFPRLAGRSLAVSLGLLIYFASLGTLPVAQAGAGLFSAPLWIALLSVILFRQRLSIGGAFAIILGFTGALMLLQPELQEVSILSLMPLGAGLFYGLGMMLTRFWCADESPIALAIGVFLVIGLVGLVMLLVVTIVPGETFISIPWTTPTPRFLWLTLLQAVGAVIAVPLIAHAYRIGNPSMVAVFEYSFLIFASLWAFLLWGALTNALAWAGIIIIVISGVLITIGTQKKTNVTHTH